MVLVWINLLCQWVISCPNSIFCMVCLLYRKWIQPVLRGSKQSSVVKQESKPWHWLISMANLCGQLHFRFMELEVVEGSRMTVVLFSSCSLPSQYLSPCAHLSNGLPTGCDHMITCVFFFLRREYHLFVIFLDEHFCPITNWWSDRNS